MKLGRSAKPTVALVATAAALASGSAAAKPPAISQPPAVAPVAPACNQDAPRQAACALVIDFFRSVNTGNYRHACSLLGATLLIETGGARCPALLAADGAQHYATRGARARGARVAVAVSTWLHELDHYRELRWLAIVASEGLRLRIIETHRIA
jgi:hypothetical protein